MKNNPLDDIVKCSIDISDAKSSEVSYDSILLVIPEPAKKVKKNMDGVTVISSKDELLEYGFTVNDTAYAAASVAFSQLVGVFSGILHNGFLGVIQGNQQVD